MPLSRPGASRAHAAFCLAVPLVALLAAVLAVGCAAPQPAPAPPSTDAADGAAPADAPPATPVEPIDQQMLALSLISYAGEGIIGPDKMDSEELAPCFVAELAKQPLVSDWELVWGPVVYRFEFALYNDNLLYAVRRRDDPKTLAVAVRGTNGPALFDWLIEDFTVFDLHEWQYGSPPPDLDPKIAHGTRKGLEILQGLVPPKGVPGAGQGIAAFLAGQVAANGDAGTTIHVTGHSLGGALSPVLALWLDDTRADWDPEGHVTLRVVPFAGPTSGNADFATYYDQRLGGATTRYHNPLDVAPLVWNAAEMREIPNLYQPLAHFDEALKITLDLLVAAVEDKHYEQIDADEPPLAYRELNPANPKFLDQADWQHHCGYVCGLGIQGDFVPVSNDCQATPANPCPECPGAG